MNRSGCLILSASALFLLVVLAGAIWMFRVGERLTPSAGGTPPVAEQPPATARLPEDAPTVTLPLAPYPTAPPTVIVATSPPTVTEKASPEPTATRDTPPLVPGVAAPEETEEEEAEASTLEAIGQTTIPVRDAFEIAVRFGRVPSDAPRVASEVDPGYQPGDVLTFNVSNIATEENFTVDATLRAQTARASWWVANDVTVAQDALERSARVFEEQTYVTNRAIFGEEWSPGMDGDPRVHIFLGEVPGVGGYFSSADEFPRSVNPFSNEKEIFYININNAQPGNSYFDGILAHEFQHMIHWNKDRNEDLWVNEGLSELAARLNGFDVGGGSIAFARNPDLPMTEWLDQTHAFYGASFLFLNYFHQRFGDDAISALVAAEGDGTAGFDEVLEPRGMTFDQLFADWVVANLLDDPAVAEGRYDYRDDVIPEPAITRIVTDYPEAGEEEVHQFGTDYIRFMPAGQRGTLEVEVTGQESVALLPTEARSGTWMMWSNRGDDGDTTLTRAFDLRGLDSATLRFWTWYDIEQDYDYAYLAVSTDGGVQWTILPTADTTEENPHGNSFGPAFTGLSGTDNPGREPEWSEQIVDLTPYAGQEILIRFESVTDDALNHNGFVVDDISLPELGYEENFEGGQGGWVPEGFVRVDNLLPQRFIIQAVIEGKEGITVLPLLPDDKNQVLLQVEDFGTIVDQVTLIVSGATPFTTAKAGYSYDAHILR